MIVAIVGAAPPCGHLPDFGDCMRRASGEWVAPNFEGQGIWAAMCSMYAKFIVQA